MLWTYRILVVPHTTRGHGTIREGEVKDVEKDLSHST